MPHPSRRRGPEPAVREEARPDDQVRAPRADRGEERVQVAGVVLPVGVERDRADARHEAGGNDSTVPAAAACSAECAGVAARDGC